MSAKYTPETATAWLRGLFQDDADSERQSAERRIEEFQNIVRSANSLSDEEKAALAHALNKIDDPNLARARTLQRSFRYANAQRFVAEFIREVEHENGPARSAERDLARDGMGLSASELRRLARERVVFHMQRLGNPPADPDALENWIECVLLNHADAMSRQAEGLSQRVQIALSACGLDLRC